MKTYYFKKGKKQKLIDRVMISVLFCLTIISSALFVTDINAVQFENSQVEESTITTEFLYEPPLWYQNALDEPIHTVVETAYVTTTEPIANEETIIVEEVVVGTINASTKFDASSTLITNVTGATADQFNDLIERIYDHRNYDGPLYGMGDCLVSVEEDYGISGTALLSIMTWESGVGEDEAADNNLAGIKKGGEYRDFKNHEECILYLGWLMDRYVNEYELISWYDIGDSYCGTGSKWYKNVSSTMSMYNEWMEEIMSV